MFAGGESRSVLKQPRTPHCNKQVWTHWAMFQMFQEQCNVKTAHNAPYPSECAAAVADTMSRAWPCGPAYTRPSSNNKSAKPDPLIRSSLNGIMIACRGSWAGPLLEIEDRWKEELEAGTGQLRLAHLE